MRAIVAVFVLAFLGLPGTYSLTRDEFFTNGRGLDNQLPTGDDISSDEIPLKVPITFYKEKYDSIFVNNNGLLSFLADISSFINTEFPLDYSTIAPFYSNVDTKRAGTVFYRETQDAYSLVKAEDDIKNSFPGHYDFQPKSVFIATWSNVGYHDSGTDKVNTFQVVIISNGTESYVELLYPEDGIQWIQARPQVAGLSDARAQVGFTSQEGKYFLMKDSGTENIRMIVTLSNCGEAGKFIYRVGDTNDVEEPDLFENNSLDDNSSPTCAQKGSKKCHPKSQCVEKEHGFCCVCPDKYYGNGKACIKNDLPLRVNGKINAEINGELLDPLDLQAYVVMSDGRTYIALSNVQDRFGYDMQTLSILGGVIGWLFAKTTGDAKNGYQLTGGYFNHTAEILFPDTNQKITVQQQYKGLDIFDQLRMEGDIKGSLPKIPAGTKLEISEYIEHYSFSSPNLILSKSSRSFKNKGILAEYPFTMTQRIEFESCPYAKITESMSEPISLKVAKNFHGYESREGILRFGMSNKVVNEGQEDPCIKGRETCVEKSSCVIDGDTFKCICDPGYQYIYFENNTMCADINECSTGTYTCGSNAQCFNQEGSYYCQCNEGFEGDGQNCKKHSLCENHNCHINAECVESYGNAYCKCNKGYVGNGVTCYLSSDAGCDVVNNCSPFATCAESEYYGTFVCQCNPGYIGDGYDCNMKEDKSTTENVFIDTRYGNTVDPICSGSKCWCPPPYVLFENECITSNAEEEENQMETTTANSEEDFDDDRLNCNVLNVCHAYAQCVLESNTGKYKCQCTAGYEGDGLECIEVEASCEEEDLCDPHAICRYDPATSKSICVCEPGYQGNGHVCSSIGCATSADCEENAECRYSSDSQLSRRICICKQGFIKDQNDACIAEGPSCDRVTCAEHATCHWDSEYEIHYCQCDYGYQGDGLMKCVELATGCDTMNDCDENADCLYDASESKYKCICNNGFHGDGHACSMEITCERDPYLCSSQATCMESNDGYVCQCNTGYHGNGTTCTRITKHEGNFLLLSQGMALLRIPLESSKPNSVRPIQMSYNQMAIGLDIDCMEGRTYWSDITLKMIKSSNYDGSSVESIFTQDIISPEGLSVDWVSRNIFWTDSRKDTIEVANLDTKLRTVLFNTDLIDPRGIAVHPYKGKVFWSDWNRQNPKIEQSNMDGSNREIFLGKEFVNLPNSLAIDFDSDELCYADAGRHTIECVKIDTMDKRTVVTNCSYPFGLAITPTHYYWTDWHTQKIECLSKESGEREPAIETLGGSGNRLYGLAAVPEECKPFSNMCQYENGQCPKTHLCLMNGSRGRTCVCGKSATGQSQEC